MGEARATATLPAGYATGAAILIAGAAVLILWTPDVGLLILMSLYAVALTAAGAVGAMSARPAGAALKDTALKDTALHETRDRANNLGLSNFAYNLPLVVGPLIVGVVLALMNGYPALPAVAGVVTLAAAAMVTSTVTCTVTRVRLKP